MGTHTFPTPGPVALRVRFEGGRLTVRAASRGDAIVDVQPARRSSEIDIEYAERTVVEQHGDEIRVLAPENFKRSTRSRQLDVTIDVPEGSAVRVAVVTATVRCDGRLARVEANSASGDVAIEHAGSAILVAASGDLDCRHTDDDLTVKSASGDVRFTDVGGAATITTASGDITGREIAGSAELRTASGDIALERAGGPVQARTASGDVRLGEVRRGTIELASSSGDVAVRVADGTPAWLDVRTVTGDVTSDLEPGPAPTTDETDVVSVHIRTVSGDIALRRRS